MIVCKEDYVNEDTETMFGGSGWGEPWTDNMGQLFRSLRNEHGRCTGHVYIDSMDGEVVPVGWVFVKRAQYGDRGPRRTYLQSTWVSVGEQDEDGNVYRYNVKTHKGTLPTA